MVDFYYMMGIPLKKNRANFELVTNFFRLLFEIYLLLLAPKYFMKPNMLVSLSHRHIIYNFSHNIKPNISLDTVLKRLSTNILDSRILTTLVLLKFKVQNQLNVNKFLRM